MSEGIAVAVLGFFGIIVTTLGGIAVARTNKQVKVVKEHVQNNHIDPRTGEAYNLRDNLDDNQRAVLQRLDYIMRQQSGMQKDIGRLGDRDMQLGDELRDINRKLEKHLDWSADWSDDIEKTVNPLRKDNQ